LRPQVQHRAAITDEVKLGGLMRCIDEYDGWPTIRAALLLLALTMTEARGGSVHEAVGDHLPEIDMEDSGRANEDAPAV
jgi:hypothetical protein